MSLRRSSQHSAHTVSVFLTQGPVCVTAKGGSYRGKPVKAIKTVYLLDKNAVGKRLQMHITMSYLCLTSEHSS